MKKIQAELYEAGDHVRVLTGYNKGKVGTVLRHKGITGNVVYMLAGIDYRSEYDEDDWDDNEYEGSYEDSAPNYLQYISKAEYEKSLVDLKLLIIPGLPVSIQFRNKQFLIGDNVVTPANAKKIAAFINKNAPKPKGK